MHADESVIVRDRRRPLRVGVVGAGPAGMAVARALLRRVPRHLHVELFDPALAHAALRGRGTPYRRDAAEPLLNAPVRYMSVDPDDAGHCVRWFDEDARSPGPAVFGVLSRPTYGLYLQAFLDDLVTARDATQEITLRPVEVAAAHATDDAVVLLSPRCEVGRFHVVVLCTGRGSAVSGPEEAGMVARTTAEHAGLEHVHIAGPGLTAVDHARALVLASPDGRLSMTSRRGLLPAVRALPGPELDMGDQPDVTSVAALAARVDEASRSWAVDVTTPRAALETRPDPSSWLVDGLQRSQSVSWSSLAVSVAEGLLPRAWRSWDGIQREVFLRRRHVYAQSWCNPMPPSTARVLLDAVESGRLDVLEGARAQGLDDVPRIDAHRSALDSPAPLDVDLVRSLVSSRRARRHRYGGLVTTSDHRVAGHGTSPPIFAVGALTQGDCHVVNALDTVVAQARSVAETIASQAAARRPRRL